MINTFKLIKASEAKEMSDAHFQKYNAKIGKMMEYVMGQIEAASSVGELAVTFQLKDWSHAVAQDQLDELKESLRRLGYGVSEFGVLPEMGLRISW